MRGDLEDKTSEDLDFEEEENVEKSNHFIGKRVCQIANQFPLYIGTKFISVLSKKGIPTNSYYSALSPDQAAFLSRLYEKCENIVALKEAENEQNYFKAAS